MLVKSITVKVGTTQRLGEYENIRLDFEIAYDVAENEEYMDAADFLRRDLANLLHEAVDAELEAAGHSPKYDTAELFALYSNSDRGCIVIAPVGYELPKTRTWAASDNWERLLPFPMRLPAVARSAELQSEIAGLPVVRVHRGASIPPLPDPGPEPLWSQRGLRISLTHLEIPEEYWEAVAALPHADNDYLRQLYHQDLEKRPLEERMRVIVSKSSEWSDAWDTHPLRDMFAKPVD